MSEQREDLILSSIMSDSYPKRKGYGYAVKNKRVDTQCSICKRNYYSQKECCNQLTDKIYKI